MIIGFDIDGCMTDDNRCKLEQYGKNLYEHGLPEMDLPYGYEYKMSFMSWPEFQTFIRDHLMEYIENIKPLMYVSEVTHKLHEDGHKIIVCTGRSGGIEQSERGEQIRKLTKQWLVENDIYHDELVFTGFPKINYVRSKGCELFVEDFPRTIDDFAKEMPVLIFDNPYNVGYQHENVTRVFSWYDIYRHIKEGKY